MGDDIHPFTGESAATSSPLNSKDYIDPLYEFRAPMYYDFCNPNEDAYDGDLWFGM